MKYSATYKVGVCTLRDISSFSSENQEYLVTGDRKGNIYIINRKDGQPDYSLFREYQGHSLGISSLCTIRSWKNEQVLITGGLDKTAKFWRVTDILNNDQEVKPFYTFESGDNICRIREISQGEIVLISWDNTSTILFENGRPNIVLNHGTLPAWDVVKSGQYYISADASKSVSIFSTTDGKLVDQIATVDSCALRCIFEYNDKIYVTSNQGNIFEFAFADGKLKQTRELAITDEPLYKFIVRGNKLFIGGEDSVIFVLDLDMFATVDVIPAIGAVWGCAFGCLTSDLCFCTDKGYVFVYTQEASRVADEVETDRLLNRLELNKIANEVLQSCDLDDIPTEIDENDARPGRFFAVQSLGKVKIFVYSHCFEKYICIGKVERKSRKVKGPGGKEYDTSITIIGEDDVPRELYLNYGDDPTNLAKTFCEQNELEERFVKQISDFIKANVSQAPQSGKKKVKNEIQGEVEGAVCYAIAEMQGRRPYMEDFSTVFTLSDGRIVFCVFDGHGGEQAAIFAKENVQRFLEKNIESETFIADSLKEMNEEMIPQFQACGTTAVVCCFSPKEHKLSVSNLGDSRAVICRQPPLQITVDHKAKDPSEMEYIEKHGGTIVDGRISGIINLGRFLGDGSLSNCTNKEPHSSTTVVQKGDRVAIGCDGIFDVLSNEECAEVVSVSGTVLDAAVGLRDRAYQAGSADNLTSLVFEIIE